MKALLLLFRFKSIGALRSWWRACKSFHGAARAIATILFMGLLVVPMFAAVLQSGDADLPEEAATYAKFAIDTLFPLCIAFFFFIGLISPKSSESLNFQPAEIDFLFSAPFTRKQLLIYKLLSMVSQQSSFNGKPTSLYLWSVNRFLSMVSQQASLNGEPTSLHLWSVNRFLCTMK